MPAVSWWVVQSRIPSHSAGSVPTQSVVQAVKKPPSSVAGPFTTQKQAYAWINQDQTKVGNPIAAVGNTVSGWFSGIGGQIGSGIESAFVSGLTDLWDVVIGPLEIAVGVIFIILAFVIFFKDDIMNAVRLFGGLAVSGAAAAA